MKKISLKTVLLSSLSSIVFLGCEPASVSYIDPSKLNPPSEKLTVNSCSVERISDLEVKLSCPDGSSQIIKNGIDGADGKSVEIIDPCGPESKIGFDEILLRMPDRTIIAYLKIDSYEHLSRLPVGHSYITTDDTRCEFKIDENGTVYDFHGGVF